MTNFEKHIDLYLQRYNDVHGYFWSMEVLWLHFNNNIERKIIWKIITDLEKYFDVRVSWDFLEKDFIESKVKHQVRFMLYAINNMTNYDMLGT
jgi:hypothetical protein